MCVFVCRTEIAPDPDRKHSGIMALPGWQPIRWQVVLHLPLSQSQIMEWLDQEIERKMSLICDWQAGSVFLCVSVFTEWKSSCDRQRGSTCLHGEVVKFVLRFCFSSFSDFYSSYLLVEVYLFVFLLFINRLSVIQLKKLLLFACAEIVVLLIDLNWNS